MTILSGTLTFIQTSIPKGDNYTPAYYCTVLFNVMSENMTIMLSGQ